MKIYQQNVEKYTAETAKLKQVLRRISVLRLLIFVVASLLFIYLISSKLFTAFFIVLFIAVAFFAFAITQYDKIAYRQQQTTFLKNINEAEISRLKCDLEGFDNGAEFINPNHAYTGDLDIFGQHSIFQLINRTTTESGRILLSKWLSEPASESEILERQTAIKDLAERLDWQQDFQAAGMHFQNKKSDYRKLLAWVEEPIVLLKRQFIYIAAAIVLSVLCLIFTYFSIINLDLPNGFFYILALIAVLFINYNLLKKVNDIANRIVETAQNNIDTLRGYQTLINKIEKESFQSKKLVDLKSVLSKFQYSATKEIEKICKLLDFSQQRGVNKVKMPIKGNPFYGVLNSFLLLDIYLIIGTEKWKSKNQPFLKSWAALVSEFEVINSFAGFAAANPNYTFPQLTEKKHFVHFESLGHPLLDANQRICNDFHSEGQGDIVMVTGSNMGGKSTFLRTVGVNIVLALAGSPCCATQAELSILKLYTSMRTQDNLKTGTSSFYAELNRIKKLLQLIDNETNVYFLLDEIFKGTNSEDRHKGGFSLINQISKLPTSGIIATHDIELAKLSGDKKLVTNYSFNSEIINQSMVFSYQLEAKICNDFNASELMKQSGIEVIDKIE